MLTEIKTKNIEEVLKLFREIKPGQTLRIMTKTGFIVGVGGLVNKMENGILYAATKNGWKVV